MIIIASVAEVFDYIHNNSGLSGVTLMELANHFGVTKQAINFYITKHTKDKLIKREKRTDTRDTRKSVFHYEITEKGMGIIKKFGSYKKFEQHNIRKRAIAKGVIL